MRAGLIVIRPGHSCNILNLIKKLEIRTTATKEWKDYLSGKTNKKPAPIEVYIYCTKGNKKERLIADLQPDKVYHPLTEALHRGVYSIVDEDLIWNDCKKNILNGKVIAKFTLKEVEEIRLNLAARFFTKSFIEKEILEHSCLSQKELEDYLLAKGGCHNCLCGYAWHIDNLVIFNKPKELKELNHIVIKQNYDNCGCKTYKEYFGKPLTHAPQSWCYIEI